MLVPLSIAASDNMPISTDMIVRIAKADLAMQNPFYRTLEYLQRSHHREDPWKVLPGDCGAILIGGKHGVIIDGNCSNGVSAPEGGAIHIYGDLTSKIDVTGHCEIVVTGDVTPEATIDGSGFCHVFIGGRFSGHLRSSDSAKIWIGGDFQGSIKTGTPYTEIHVGNDYAGSVSPDETAALLFLTVSGFAPQASVLTIADCGYTVFNASIARSDIAAGLYPRSGYHKVTSSGRNSFNRWCVETENREQQPIARTE